SASQLADFVSFGIAPEDILIAGYDEAAQTGNEKASDVNPDRLESEPRSKPQWIDSVAPDVDHPSLPEATDVVENEIEVM
ncbi:MAG: hypothetical protein JXA69_15730, partial [Phycisphaerae bacterium]|nr:hypothetical protein [Phycisphaerae bacterium]